MLVARQPGNSIKMSAIYNSTFSSVSEFENFLDSRSSFGNRQLSDEEDTMPLSVGVREKRPNKSLFKEIPKLSPLTAPELDSQLQLELRDVPALKYDFSNTTIEKMLGFAVNPEPPTAEVEFIDPIPDRDVRSLYFKVDENEFVKVDETNFKEKRADDSSEHSEEVISSTLSETSSSLYAPSAAYFGPLRIRNAAILSLLRKAEDQDSL